MEPSFIHTWRIPGTWVGFHSASSLRQACSLRQAEFPPSRVWFPFIWYNFALLPLSFNHATRDCSTWGSAEKKWGKEGRRGAEERWGEKRWEDEEKRGGEEGETVEGKEVGVKRGGYHLYNTVMIKEWYHTRSTTRWLVFYEEKVFKINNSKYLCTAAMIRVVFAMKNEVFVKAVSLPARVSSSLCLFQPVSLPAWTWLRRSSAGTYVLNLVKAWSYLC